MGCIFHTKGVYIQNAVLAAMAIFSTVSISRFMANGVDYRNDWQTVLLFILSTILYFVYIYVPFDRIVDGKKKEQNY